MKSIATIVLLFSALYCEGQGAVIDTCAIREWKSVGNGIISDDGQYVSYTVANAMATGQSGRELVVQSVDSGWRKTFYDGEEAAFSHDSRYLVFKRHRDTAVVLSLGGEVVECISDVADLRIRAGTRSDFLVYRLRSNGNVIIRKLESGIPMTFRDVKYYLFNSICTNAIIECTFVNGRDSVIELRLLDLQKGSVKAFWSGRTSRPMSFAFDNSGSRVAFVVEEKVHEKAIYTLWYYEQHMDTAELLVGYPSLADREGWEVARREPRFSKNGQSILFGLKHLAVSVLKRSVGQTMQVWSYKDAELQPLQAADEGFNGSRAAAVGIRQRNIVQLEKRNERVIGEGGKWVLVQYSLGYFGSLEASWNMAARSSFALVNIENGRRIDMTIKMRNLSGGMCLSPEGKWVLYYDFSRKNYFSYDIATGVIRNITIGCHANWTANQDEYPEESLPLSLANVSWLAGDQAVLLSDTYDIWQIDPSMGKRPLNLTNGYGRRHKIEFTVIRENSVPEVRLVDGGTMIIGAVDEVTKNRGFYSIRLSSNEHPRLISTGPFVYSQMEGRGGHQPFMMRAKECNCYLILRMDATSAPNYYFSKDLKKFELISNVQPQLQYNWFTTELVHWRTLDGRHSDGILYKPENFDRSKKYPVIFEYYEKGSQDLNLFITPELASGKINIPWFVSRGYLIFVPDIQYRIGNPGRSAYNSVVSAALELSKRPYVDSKRMGLQGHSFGGYETNYIVTHTGIFAAACSASGISDLIEMYGSLARAPYPTYWAEHGQGRMGIPPWEGRNLYISNSPIFEVKRETTPLLLMHNKNDELVPFSQSAEFFSALRRLGKKVWLLQYDGSGHFIEDQEAQEDYTLRVTQFFDHYLKGALPPLWLTHGWPSDKILAQNGMRLDTEAKRPVSTLNPEPSATSK